MTLVFAVFLGVAIVASQGTPPISPREPYWLTEQNGCKANAAPDACPVEEEAE